MTDCTPVMTELAARCMANEVRRQAAHRCTHRRSNGRMTYAEKLRRVRAQYAVERDSGLCPGCHKKNTDTYVYCKECRLKMKIRKALKSVSKPTPTRAETEKCLSGKKSLESNTILHGGESATCPLKPCRECGVPKAISFYQPSQWKLNYGRCRACMKEINGPYQTRTGRATRCVPFTSVPMGETN